jgi:hypothetical protein
VSILHYQKLCRPPQRHHRELGKCQSEVTVDNGPASNSIADGGCGCGGTRQGAVCDEVGEEMACWVCWVHQGNPPQIFFVILSKISRKFLQFHE